MNTILIPIRKPFCDLIFNGVKSVEYRKKRPSAPVDKILIYEARGSGLIVGEAMVKEVAVAFPDEIWRLTASLSGIDRNLFRKYYDGREVAVAFFLDDIKRYGKPGNPADFGIKRAPQNFVWIEKG